MLPFLLTLAKGEGSTGCCYKPFVAATDLHLLHQGRWVETISMQPQSIFYPANPSAGCQLWFHKAQLLFSLSLNKKTVFIQLLFFPRLQMQTSATNSSLKRQIIARQYIRSRKTRDIINSISKWHRFFPVPKEPMACNSKCMPGEEASFCH